MSYNLTGVWLKKMQPYTLMNTTKSIACLLDGLKGTNDFKMFAKFKTKVVTPALANGYRRVKLNKLYNYVLQRSSFKDDPEYAIMSLQISNFNTGTGIIAQARQNYLNYTDISYDVIASQLQQ